MSRTFQVSKKRAEYFDVTDYLENPAFNLPDIDEKNLTQLDVIYRALVSILFNYVPTSGHPGGSISSGRFVSHLLYHTMDYDFSNPLRLDNDIISYTAGHKALGLYAMWALRNECVRATGSTLLPKTEKMQLRLEDLLGFRRNTVQGTPLFTKFHAKPLGGHPEPLVPFVRTSTGASGVGVGSGVGLAFGAADAYGENCPKVNMVEGEGGLTAGRVSEAVAMASTAQLKNVVFHLDWNEASIESERVTAENGNPGDYVQWTPLEFFYIHDVNVIYVPNGHDFKQIHIAQQLAKEIKNHQPTAIVYRTTKGWKYGIEGKASHGGGHKFASDGFYASLEEFEKTFNVKIPHFEGDKTPENVERYFWESLQTVRQVVENNKELSAYVAKKLQNSVTRLDEQKRVVRADLGNVEKLFQFDPQKVPAQFNLKVGESYTTRGILGDVLGYLNKETNGAILMASADLYGSTGAAGVAKPFAAGNFNTQTNPKSRRLSAGGICEDGMAAVCTGISAFGKHVGVSSSYGAFLAFEHVAARLHAIGVQAAREAGQAANTFILFNGHASLPTGEDGPTHADPQALQLVQDNFPKGSCITATPLEVDEIWPLLAKSLSLKPAVFSPFVIRPSNKLMDRVALGVEDAQRATQGVYYLRRANGKADGTIFVQGAGVGREVIEKVLPALKENVNIIYVTSRELFEQLPQAEQEKLVPTELLKTAMGITDFTLPTLDCWLNSVAGRKHSLYPHKDGRFLSSGSSAKVYEEAHLDGASILTAIKAYVNDLKKASHWC